MDRISAIERRAAGLNLTLAGVCRRADIDYTLVWRWRNGQTRPLVQTFTTATAALERKLDELEQEMRSRLDRRTA